MLHCKSCRNNRDESEFKKDSRSYKTCNSCRVTKNRRPQTLEDCQQLAESRGGLCLSKTYIRAKEKIEWQCGNEHQWKAHLDQIKSGKWCPVCSGNVRLTIEECQQFAESKNGKCLSETYTNCESKMEWQCENKHQWKTAFHCIKSGKWCPYCQEYRSEKICREILEQYTGLKFTKIRPEWLDRLELDGYNAEYNMAFEYNGRQHYEYTPHFHRNGISDFHYQQERDERKYKLCDKHKVQLIIIPHTFSFKKPQELEDFIVSELEHLMF